MNALPKSLQLDDEGYICDERGILVDDNPDFMRAMVARYNTHTALVEAVQALRMLVELKDYREQHGKDEYYEQRKSHVWAVAHFALEQAK